MNLLDVSKLKINIWFLEGHPVIKINGIEYYRGMIISDTYDNIETSNVIDEIVNNYKIRRTYNNIPYLKYNDFIWKEGIIYSKNIKSYLIKHEKNNGPLSCVACKHLHYSNNIFENYCSWCMKQILSV